MKKYDISNLIAKIDLKNYDWFLKFFLNACQRS